MAFLQRGLLIYLFIALAMVFAYPQAIFNGNTPADNTVLSWFNLALNTTCTNVPGQTDFSNCVYIPNSASQFSNTVGNNTNTFTTPSSPSSSGSIIGFLDPVFQVFSWVGLFFKIIFSPIILLTSGVMVGAPTALILLFGIPLVFLMIIGLITFIRSGWV